MTDLKTVLVDALIEASDGFDMVSKATPDIVEFMIEEYDGPGREVIVHTDRLATAVLAWATIHFLDREKVRSVILSVLEEVHIPVNNGGFKEITFADPDEDGWVEVEWGHASNYTLDHHAISLGDGYLPTDQLVDRLIEGLAGGAST